MNSREQIDTAFQRALRELFGDTNRKWLKRFVRFLVVPIDANDKAREKRACDGAM